jgi:cell fate regulator YaaT (PSP1 superfamily)
MPKVVGVSFDKMGKIYNFLSSGLKLNIGDLVVVESEKGLQLGYVKINEYEIKNNENKLKKVIRKATKKDIKINEKNSEDAKKAITKCQKIANSYNLNMKIIKAYYTLDRDKLVFNFVAENWVDFRELAKTLASIYKTRIELLQVGIRDKAKEVGGYGQCGRSLCCHTFLKDIESVSISMAKNQNISLNPNKINGVCGRLLCCLKYEDEGYKCCRKHLPKIGDKIQTESGEGTVIGLDILKQKYRVNVPKIGIVEVDKTNVSN